MVDRTSFENQANGCSQGTRAGGNQGGKFDNDATALLPEGFAPGKWDVICQRGKECFDHGTLCCSFG